ncbi:hypothetical protein EAH79_14590 [Sphingomonas koreensis]|nr:hypothetical protein EAH79_14590 [Sphingomonas koreensis]
MTATYRLKGLGWLAMGVFVALAFYLVSLQVSVERKKLETVDRQIAQAHDDIRSLETEFSTRANLAQLERWNGEVLALTAPTPAQYVHSEQALASLDFNGGAQVQMASLVIPSLPTMAPPVDAAQPVATPAPAASRASAPAPVMMAAAKPAASHAIDAARATVQRAAAAPVRLASVDRARAQAVAMLDRKLLSDTTLGDLMSGARAETASLR